MRAPGIRKQRGFSLLEVLVAMAILATTYGAVLQILGSATRNASRVDDYRYAMMLAESRLTVALVDPAAPVFGSSADGFAWSATVDQLPGAEFSSSGSGFTPRLVTVTVSWGPEGSGQREVSLSSVRLERSSGE